MRNVGVYGNYINWLWCDWVDFEFIIWFFIYFDVGV